MQESILTKHHQFLYSQFWVNSQHFCLGQWTVNMNNTEEPILPKIPLSMEIENDYSFLWALTPFLIIVGFNLIMFFYVLWNVWKIQNLVKIVARNLWNQITVRNLQRKKSITRRKRIVDVKMTVCAGLQWEKMCKASFKVFFFLNIYELNDIS